MSILPMASAFVITAFGASVDSVPLVASGVALAAIFLKIDDVVRILNEKRN